jgi:DNA-binding transcriptional ArsR family regulator
MTQTSGVDEVFHALSAPSRREMLALMARRELPVTELAESFEMTLSAVSQHLTVLKTAGLVTQRKAGKQRLYRTNAEPLKQVQKWLEFYEPFWSGKLADLGKYLDQPDLCRDNKESQE